MEDHFGKKEEEKEIVVTEDVKVKTENKKGLGNNSYETNRADEEKLEKHSSFCHKQSSDVLLSLIERECRGKEVNLMERMEKEVKKRMDEELEKVKRVLEMMKKPEKNRNESCCCCEEEREEKMDNLLGKVKKANIRFFPLYFRFTE